MSDRPSAAARVWDLAALALAAGGGAVYVAAHQGMQGILATQIHATTIEATKEAPNITRWVHYRTMSNIGLALVVAGVAVGVTAFVRSRREALAGRVPLADGTPIIVPDAPPNAPPG
jgi:cation transporter-like permease